jgi:hypothetical protein
MTDTSLARWVDPWRSNDYDAWSKLVNDPRWSYNGLLPYFRKTEQSHNANSQSITEQHGYEGPVYTQSISSAERDYPLREPLKAAWESVGVRYKADCN